MKTHWVGKLEEYSTFYITVLFARQLRLEWEWFMKNWTDFPRLSLYTDRCRCFLVGKFPVVEENEDFMFLTTSNKTRFVVNSVVYDFVNWSKTSTVSGYSLGWFLECVNICLYKSHIFDFLRANRPLGFKKTMQIGKQNHLDGTFWDATR